MDQNKTHNTESEISVAVVNSYTNPLPMERMKEVFPTETKASAKPARYKPLPWDKERVFSQDPTLCMHWLNLPLNDGLLFVSQVYQQIKATVDAYQLEHVDAFYEQYSDLLEAVLSDTEKANRDNLTTNYLRMKHKVFDRRLAHLLFHYYNAMYMLEGSLANLCILANVNGPGKFKDFGVACKVSLINTRTNRYQAFPKPIGSENYVTNYTKFAAGKTFNGAAFVSVPHWITDIYGNRGQHCFNLSDLASGFGATGDVAAAFDQNGNDYETLTHLMNNMYEVIHTYGADVSRGANKKHYGQLSNKLDPKNKCTAIPSDPYIENGAALAFEATNDLNDGDTSRDNLYSLNYSGAGYEAAMSYVKDGDGNDIKTDNIIARAWDTYLFWASYAEEYFADFAMPTSQIHELFIKLGYLEKSKPNTGFFSLINTDVVFDALEIRREMVYKKNNKANTATIVKWAPLFDHGDGTGSGSVKGTDFEKNFNRYPVDMDDAFEIIKKSEEFPSLTPTVFHEVSQNTDGKLMPYVINTVGSGSILLDGESDSFPAAGILGRFSSLFDVACSSNIDPSSDVIDTIAIDPDTAREFIKRNDSIILKERPTSPRVFSQPLIDCTDPYQCGFNVIIAANSETSNEFERWFKDTSNYYNGDNLTPGWVPTNQTSPYNISVPGCAILEFSGVKGVVENRVFNEAYRNIVKHAVIFVGDAVFLGPQLAASKLASGNYGELCVQKNDGTFISNIIGAFTNMNPDPTADLPGDETHTEAIVKSVAIAACFSDPGVPITDCNSEYVTMKGAFPLMYNDENVKLKFTQYTFNPAYGIVCPVVYDVPDCGLLPSMGYEGQMTSTTTRDPAASYGIKQYVANGKSGGGFNSTIANAGNRMSVGSIKSHVDYDSRFCASQFLLWFIDKVKFKRLYTIGRQIYSCDDVVTMQAFSSAAKAFLALLQRGIVFWNGVEDTLFLYNIPAEKRTLRNLDFGSVGGIDFGGLIRLPVVKNVIKPSYRLDYKEGKRTDLRTEQAIAIANNPGMTSSGESTKSSDSKSKRRHHHKRGKRQNDDNKSKESMKSTSRENEFDPSDKKIDDITKDIEKSPATKSYDKAVQVM